VPAEAFPGSRMPGLACLVEVRPHCREPGQTAGNQCLLLDMCCAKPPRMSSDTAADPYCVLIQMYTR
jgi:hypothetical protein